MKPPKARPIYYELCVTYGMMIGVRVIENPYGQTAFGYAWRSYAVGEDKGPGEVHKTVGTAYESALARSGFVIVRGRLVSHFPGQRITKRTKNTP
jgi:hypothetical protein